MKKKILFVIVAALILCCLTPASFAEKQDDIVILYENDVHCVLEGYSKLAALKSELAEEHAYVGVVSSVNFSAKEFLQSAVYDNGDVMFNLLDVVGERSTPAGLTIKPFASYDISTITTAQMLRWTVALAAIPAVITLIAGVIVLVKRRRA